MAIQYDGEVRVKIDGDNAAYKKAVLEAEAQTAKTAKSMAAIMENTGKVMSVALTKPILLIGTYAVKAAIGFESSFAGVRKTVDATEEEFKQLAEASRKMSETKPISANDINRIMELGGQLGIATDKLEGFAGTIADLSVTTDLDIEEGATQMAQYANITGMAQDRFENFGSTIVALGNTTATTESAIMNMAHRIAGAGSQVGLTDDQILALSASLSSVGIEAEAGGTAISTIMSQIDKDVAMSSENVATWAKMAGYESAESFASAWKTSPISALQNLMTNMNSTADSGGNMNLMLDELGISSLRQTDMMKRLSSASDMLSGSIDTASSAWTTNNAMQNEAAQRYATTESQLQIFQNKMENAASVAGGPLLAALNAMLGGLEPVVGMVRDAAQAFADADPKTQGMIMTFAGIVAAIGPVLVVSAKLIESTRTVKDAYKGMIAPINAAKSATEAETTAETKSAAAKTASAATCKAKVTSYNQLTMFSKQSSAALNSETAATTANTIAANTLVKAKLSSAAASIKATASSGAHTVGLGIQTATTGIATVATTVFSTALKAIPGMLVVTAITAIVSAVSGYISTSQEAEVGTTRLTKTSQEQKDKVDGLKASWDKAAASQGANSQAAQDAQYVYEQENAIFEETKQTVAELRDEFDKTIESHNQMSESLAGARSETNSQAGAVRALANQVAGLASDNSRTAEQQAELATKTRMLNDMLGEEAVTVDEVTGKVNLSEDAIRALGQAEAERLSATNAMEDYSQRLIDQARIEEELTAATELLNDERDRTNQGFDESGEYTGRYSEALLNAQTSVNDLTTAQEDNNKAMQEDMDIMKQSQSNKAALTQATNDVKNGTLKAAEAAEKYNEMFEATITAEQIEGQVMLENNAAKQEAVAKTNEHTQAVKDYAAAHPEFQAALEQSGVSAEEFAAELDECGMSMDDFAKDVEDMAARATDGTKKMGENQKLSLEDYRANLEHNATVTRDWGANMATIMATTGLDSSNAWIQSLQAMGPEYSGLIAEIAAQSPEDMLKIADAVAKGGDDAKTAFMQAFGISAAAAEEMVKATEAVSTSGVPETTKEEGAEGGEGYGEGYAEGIESTTPRAKEASEKLKNESVQSLNGGVGYQEAYSAGANLGGGFFDGVASVSEAAYTTGQNVSDQVVTGLNGGAGYQNAYSAGANLGSGYYDGINTAGGGALAAGRSVMTQAVAGMASGNEGAQSAGVGLSSQLASGISAGTPLVSFAVLAVSRLIVDSYTKINTTPQGMATSTKLAGGINGGRPAITASVLSIVTDVISSMQSLPNAAYNIGSQTSLGMARGIYANSAAVSNAMASVVRAAINRGRAEADINSPSRKTYEDGRMLPAGWAGGILKDAPLMIRAMEETVRETLEAGNRVVDGFDGLSLAGFDDGYLGAERMAVQLGSNISTTANSQTINNYYSFDGKLIQEGTREAEAMELLMGIPHAIRMGVR